MKKTSLTARVAELETKIKATQADKDLLIAQVRTDIAILCQSERPQIQHVVRNAESLLRRIEPLQAEANVAFCVDVLGSRYRR